MLLQALADLDLQGMFGKGREREHVVINVTKPGEEDEVEMVMRARTLNPPAALQKYEQDLLGSRVAAIAVVEQWLERRLPAAYVVFLLTHSDQVVGDQARLYDVNTLIEQNALYETKVYCPAYLVIGDDGGARAMVIPVDEPLGRVFLVDHGAMTPDCFVLLPQAFDAWLKSKCPLDVERCPADMRALPTLCISVRWPTDRVSASALKSLRAVSPASRNMRLAELTSLMVAGRSFELGNFDRPQGEVICRRFEAAGFVVTSEERPAMHPLNHFVSLRDLLSTVRTGSDREVDYAVYWKDEAGDPQLDDLVLIARPVEVQDDDCEMFPEIATAHGYGIFCSDQILQDVVDLAISQLPNVDEEWLRTALLHYLERDAFLDVPVQ